MFGFDNVTMQGPDMYAGRMYIHKSAVSIKYVGDVKNVMRIVQIST
jgi:hypothetical protein